MPITTRNYDPKVFTSRSWSPGFYDNTTSSSYFQTTIRSDYMSVRSNRKFGVLQLRENPFTLYREKVTVGVVFVDARYELLKRYTHTWSLAPASVPLPLYADFERPIVWAAWRQVYSEVGALKSNLALIVAERQETVNMLNRAFKMIAGFSDAYRKKNWNEAFIAAGIRSPRGSSPNAKNGFGQAANAHLWLNLGLLPIAQDIYAMVNKDLRPPTLRVAKSQSYKGEHVTTQGADYGQFTTTVGFKTRVTVSAKADIPSLDYFAANIAQQLGLTNPVSLAWELMPYSFVVNWFVDIGSFLSQFDAFSGLRLLECSETYTREAVILGQTFKGSTLPGFPKSTTFFHLRQRSKGISKQKYRYILAVPPLTPPRVPLLDGLNISKMVTLMALVAQKRLS